jgi:hypothetical protein
MPQGKGTYGSQVGRPSKKGKKKYNIGGNVDPFSTRNPEGVPATQLNEAMENQNMANAGLPTANAQERSQVSPDVTSYKEGGKVKSKKVDITDIVKDVETVEALEYYYKKLPKKSKGELMSAKDFIGRKLVDTKVGIEKKKKEILKRKKK